MQCSRMLTVRIVLRDRALVAGGALLALLTVFLWLYPLRLAGAAEPVFLHASVHFGVDMTGKWNDLFAVAAGGTAIAVVHAILAVVLGPRESEAARFAVGSGVALLILTSAALLHIVGLNG